MSISLDNKLVVAVASSALFDLPESDAVFQVAVANRDIRPYVDHMREHEEVPFPKRAAFPFIRRLLLIKDRLPEALIEVVFLSRNSADTGLRVMNTIQHYGLDITRGAFLDGDPPWPYMKSFNAAPFLAGNEADVLEANRLLLPAGKVVATEYRDSDEDETLRIAFDFDGVLADDQSDCLPDRGPGWLSGP